ncbi:hypothetical protein [Streptacidiphilus cavernicola]|uniref:Uncharacterized protein n=1 Tax=Streptacidiphilus cavernicola TaxID=3342716 RepID=A0ABV6VQI3_9ACTN
MTTSDESGKQPDEETRERSAEERNVVAPTPRDVREKGEENPEEAPEVQPPGS